MHTLAEYLQPEAIKKLTIPSNFRLGNEIADKKGVELIEIDSNRALAKISLTGLQKRTVEFNVTDEGLKWTCTCSKKGNFCKHCVALGIAIYNNATKSRKKE